MSAVEPFALSSTIGTWRRSWSWRITSNPSRSGSARSSSTMSGRSSSSTASAASPRWAATTRNPSPDRASATCRVTLGSSATRTSGGVVMVTAPFDVQFAPRGQIATPPGVGGQPGQARRIWGRDGRRIPIETSGGGASGPQRGYAVRRFPACVAQRPRSPDVLRRVQAPAARHRRGRDPGLARLARPGRGPGGREPGPIPDVQAAEARAPAARRAAEPDQHPLHQHDQPRAGAVLPRRRGARAPDPAAGPVERGGDGPAREQPVPRPRRPPRDVRVGGQPVRGGLQPLLQGQGRSGRRRPGVLPGPRGARHLRPGLPRGPPVRGPARPLPARGGRQRAELVSAPPADAGLLGVPDGLDGPRPAGLRLPGAVQPLPAEPGDQGHEPAARLGVPRRRRDGRARVDRRHLARRPRRPRQPDVRHQLQPAAPRRPRPGQRQGDPGARGPVPRRRLERDQGRLGPRVGRAAGARRRRRAGREDERDPRRRVPEVLGVERRLRPRALLRPGPAAAPDRRAPLRRRHPQAAPRRPRLPQGLRRVQGGDRVRRRPDGDPGQDGEGLDAGPGRRGAQHHPPGEEAQRDRAQGVPRPPRAADPRRPAQGRAVLPPRPRLGGGAVPPGAAQAARRAAAAPRRACRSRCPSPSLRSTPSSRPAARRPSRRRWCSPGSCAT